MKKKAYPGSLYDLRGVEKWLENLSARGLHLEEFSNLGKLAKLQEGPPTRRRYYLEPDFDQYGSEEAEKVYIEEGWNYVCNANGIFWVYETEDLWALKPQGWTASEKDLRKKWRNLWLDLIVWVFSLGLAGWKAIVEAAKFQIFDSSYYEWLAGIWLILIPLVFTVLLEFWVGLTKSYDLYIWRQYVRRQEDAASWQGMKVVRWVEYYIFPVFLTAMGLVLLAANGITGRTYIPISRQNHELPMVTLDITEEELYYAPESSGPSINVSFMRRLVIPQDIHINSIGLYENPGDWDAWAQRDYISHPDAEMKFAYYRLWTEKTAIRLAEDYGAQWEIQRGNNEKFDDFWFGSNQFEREYLVAQEGDVVVTVIYQGESTLEAHIDEIYEIVTDYRGG